MKKIKLFFMYFVVALIFFQCQDTDLVAPQQNQTPAELVAGTTYQTGTTYYVSTAGNDTGTGSSTSPWRTLRYASTRVAANGGHTIKLAAGTYVENGQISVPTGVNIEGAGKDQTIIKAVSSFYYNPTSPAYATEKFLISLNSGSFTAGRQVLKNFTIDGDGKKVHGGIYVHYRTHVNIENVKVQYTNFTGIWLWDMKDGGLKNVSTLNCSWASSGWQSGAINVGNLERVEFDGVDVNESVGYGVKAIGPSGFNQFKQFIVHHSRFSVNPVGTWNGGSAPNIAFELWQSQLVACQIYNNTFDNTLSLVNSNGPAATGVQAVRIYNNTFDMETRAQGAGYSIELSIHDVEVDHNYFIKGSNGIANWDNAFRNWSIHHNIFYGIQGTYPGEAVRSQRSGLHNVKFYNNTIEFAGTKTANVVGVYGGASNGVDIKNNLIINSNTSYNYYQNQLIHYENGATIANLSVGSNLLQNLPLGSLVGSILSNLLGNDPKINKTGVRPTPYYVPASGSPLIDAGVNVGLPFAGSRPDIGAYETGMSSSAPAPAPTTPTTPTTPTGSYMQVELDASQAATTGKMIIGNDAAAGSYFGMPAGNGTNWYLPAPSAASYSFQAPKTDSYTLWVRVKAVNGGGFHIYDGRGRWTTWNPGTQSNWTWVKVTSSGANVAFSLQEGSNAVTFGWMNDNVQVDKVLFTNNPSFTPTN